MVQGLWRTGLSAVLAGAAFSVLSGLTFYDIGVRLGILFNPAHQSPKVLAVVPGMVMAQLPYIIFVGWTVMLITPGERTSVISGPGRTLPTGQ